MSHTYFIADPHFGHENMAKLRGFPDSNCHDQNFIAQWNAYIGKRDLVYILGDITRSDPKYLHLLGELEGRKVVILGNHDTGKGYMSELLKYVDWVGGFIHYSSKVYGRIWLSHAPIHPLEFNEFHQHPVKYNIHGHIHDAYKMRDSRYINVSAEVINYIPRTLDELIDLKQLKLIV